MYKRNVGIFFLKLWKTLTLWHLWKMFKCLFFDSSSVDRMVAPELSCNPDTASSWGDHSSSSSKEERSWRLHAVTCWINQILETDVHCTAPTSLPLTGVQPAAVRARVWACVRPYRQAERTEKLRTRKLLPQVFFLCEFPLFSLRTSIKEELARAQHRSVRCRGEETGTLPEMDVKFELQNVELKGISA